METLLRMKKVFQTFSKKLDIGIGNEWLFNFGITVISVSFFRPFRKSICQYFSRKDVFARRPPAVSDVIKERTFCIR